MSKITQALEKAARERLLRERHLDAPTVTVPPDPEGHAVVSETVASKVDPHIVPLFDRKSVIAEQYRMVRTNLQSLKNSRGYRLLLVTSAMHNEGKTVTSLNLALTLAQQPNCRVLLIDADLRKGSVQQWLGLEARAGLYEALTDGVDTQETLVQLESSTLTILPAGKLTSEPAELLDSAKMRELLHQLKRQFDYVLVDSPPVMLVSDPSVLSRHVDGVLFVVRAGRTQRRQLLDAQAKLEQVNAKTIGTILTHAEYYNPFYSRYYRHYYHHEKSRDAAQVSASVS